MKEEEIIIVNDIPFYRILDGTSYTYAPIPKEFKPYFERLQQENQQLKDNWNKLKEHLTNRYNNGTESISYRQVFIEIREMMQELEQGSDNQ